MSWVQENKFTSALAGVTLVGSVALIALTSQQSEAYDKAAGELKKSLKTEANMQNARPYPNAVNVEAVKRNVAEFSESALDLQKQFQVYRPTAAELADVEPVKFSKMVAGYRSRLNEKFKQVGAELPESVVYGFEAYANKLPRPDATGELHYQMNGLEWLFSSLAENQPESLINVVRPKQAIESEAVVAPKKRSRRGSRAKNAVEGAFTMMPVELSFSCSEAQLNGFLENIANSPKFYFAVRTIRVQNQRLTAPSNADAKFAASESSSSSSSSGFGGFDGFDTGADSDAAEVAVVEEISTVASDSDETRLLHPVLGSEKLNVFMRLDLLVLTPGEGVSLDEVTSDQPSKG